MALAISDLQILLSSMEPVVNPGVYVYCTVPHDADLSSFSAVACLRESEALTLILEESDALRAGLTPLFRCSWITLGVHSDLQAVGLTAAFATALGQAAISCNVIAGAFHDHIFVPVESAARAITVLQQLQSNASRSRLESCADV